MRIITHLLKLMTVLHSWRRKLKISLTLVLPLSLTLSSFCVWEQKMKNWQKEKTSHHSVVCVSFGFTFSSSYLRCSVPSSFPIFVIFTFLLLAGSWQKFLHSSADVLFWSHLRYDWDEKAATFYSLKPQCVSVCLLMHHLLLLCVTCCWFNLWQVWHHCLLWWVISSEPWLDLIADG